MIKNSYTKENISCGLRKLRKDYKLSQEEIAKLLQIDRSTYSYYELGRTTINIFNLVSLCQFYDITLDEFLNICKK